MAFKPVHLVSGTRGYERNISQFVTGSQALEFEEINRDFLPYLPAVPSRILDAGCGAGQNAAALRRLGHSVTAVDPMAAFLNAARARYGDLGIVWIEDSLPALASLDSSLAGFDFILIDGVWHHLDYRERGLALARVASLLADGGRCALSLRNGPAGMGTHVYPTNVRDTIRAAEAQGLHCVFSVENQPSILKGKERVSWARLVIEKNPRGV